MVHDNYAFLHRTDLLQKLHNTYIWSRFLIYEWALKGLGFFQILVQRWDGWGECYRRKTTTGKTRLVATLFHTQLYHHQQFNAYQATDRLVHVTHTIAAIQLMPMGLFCLFFIRGTPLALDRWFLQDFQFWRGFVGAKLVSRLQCPYTTMGYSFTQLQAPQQT